MTEAKAIRLLSKRKLAVDIRYSKWLIFLAFFLLSISIDQNIPLMFQAVTMGIISAVVLYMRNCALKKELDEIIDMVNNNKKY
jgi:hypothetical protein